MMDALYLQPFLLCTFFFSSTHSTTWLPLDKAGLAKLSLLDTQSSHFWGRCTFPSQTTSFDTFQPKIGLADLPQDVLTMHLIETGPPRTNAKSHQNKRNYKMLKIFTPRDDETPNKLHSFLCSVCLIDDWIGCEAVPPAEKKTRHDDETTHQAKIALTHKQ